MRAFRTTIRQVLRACDATKKNEVRNFAISTNPFGNYAEKASSLGLAKFIRVNQMYEDLFGVTELKQTQQQVLEAERDFLKTQDSRRQKQDELQDLHTRLRDIHFQLDKTSRGEDRYLHLLTQEHAIIKQEKIVIDELRRIIRVEKHCFTILSNSLRLSHEKERQKGERIKYQATIGSVGAALIGIIVGTVATQLKRKDIKAVFEEEFHPVETAVQETVAQLSNLLQNQQRLTASFVLDLKTMLNDGNLTSETFEPKHESILNSWVTPEQSHAIKTAIVEYDTKLASDMSEIKKMVASERGFEITGTGDVVYVGPSMVDFLNRTEKNLETKLKLSSLISVVLVYGALAVTVPVLYALFRGGS